MNNGFSKRLDEVRVTYGVSRRLLGLYWEMDKLLFVGNSIVVLIPAVVPFVNAYIYKLIIDLIVNTVKGSAFDTRYLVILILLRLLTLFIQNMAFSAQSFIDKILWTRFPGKLFQMVLGKLSELDLEYFETGSFKDKLEKIRETYVWQPINMISYSFYAFQTLAQLLIAVVAIALLNWLLIIPILLSAAPVFISQAAYAKTTWGIWSQSSPYRKKFWYLSDLLQEGASIKEVKIFQIAPKLLSELKGLYDKFAIENIAATRRRFRIDVFLNFLTTAIYMGIEAFVIFLAVFRKITIGDINYYTAVLSNFEGAVNGFFSNISRMFDSSLYIKEMFEVLDAKPKIIASKMPVKMNIKQAPLIEFKNIDFAYPGSDEKVFQDFSMRIEPGEKIALVGENGAGKTTLIKLLARFYDVDKGQILINGTDIKELELESWHKTLGVLFQDFIKYQYPFKDNIYFGKIFESEDIEEIKKAARMSGADKVAEKLPGGYDQILGKSAEEGVDLSIGQWQKVALARAFFRSAPVLILDEPTSALDAKAESQIFEQVEDLSTDKTLFIISHRFSTVKNADKIYVIEGGKIIESGSHEELIKKAGTYATLFELQAKAYRD